MDIFAEREGNIAQSQGAPNKKDMAIRKYEICLWVENIDLTSERSEREFHISNIPCML